MSQGDLATALGVERSTVARWEAGRNDPQPWARPALAKALQVSEEQLDDLLSHDGEGFTVDRRAFAGLATGLALAPLTRPRLGSAIGAAEVRELRARTARLRRLDDHLSGMDTYGVYTSEMGATAKLIKQSSYSQRISRELTGILAEQAQMAGWAAFDAGRVAESRKHYRTALAAARDSNDPGLIGNTLIFMAYEKADRDTAAEGTRVAGREVTPRVSALLHERLAWTHAVAGQTHAAEKALDLATSALDRPAADRPEPDWVHWVDELEVTIMTGRCYTELRKPAQAIPVLEGALGRYDDTHSRDKALYLTWLATAHLDNGDAAQAAAVTESALDLAAGVGSVRPGARLRDVLRRLAQCGGPEVAAVLERARG